METICIMTSRPIAISVVVALVGVVGMGYTVPRGNQQTAPTAEVAADAPPTGSGFSGLAQVNDSTYLAVHNKWYYEDGHRLTIIRMEAGSAPTFDPVEVDDWLDSDGPASDLESICAIPARPNEFILAESGYWEEDYGRLFHVELDAQRDRATVIGAAKLPLFQDNNLDQTGDQFEGLECAAAGADAVLLILGERGGSESYQSGRLRWGTLDLMNHVLTFSAEGERGIEVDAPGPWSDGGKNRDIAALHLDDEGTLWAAAAEDPSDFGPFQSVIYRVGRVNRGSTNALEVDETIVVWKEVHGFKIEGLAGPSALVGGSSLSFGTDDELHGGVLRFL